MWVQYPTQICTARCRTGISAMALELVRQVYELPWKRYHRRDSTNNLIAQRAGPSVSLIASSPRIARRVHGQRYPYPRECGAVRLTGCASQFCRISSWYCDIWYVLCCRPCAVVLRCSTTSRGAHLHLVLRGVSHQEDSSHER